MDQAMSTEKKKRVRLPYPAHVEKDIAERAKAYADGIANKGTVGHENAFYDYINGAIWARNNSKR